MAEARAKIVDVEAGTPGALAIKEAQSCEVSFGKIHDVNIVPHTGPVWCQVVITINGQLGTSTHGDLRDEGHEIVRFAGGVFADDPTRVRSHLDERTRMILLQCCARVALVVLPTGLKYRRMTICQSAPSGDPAKSSSMPSMKNLVRP